MPRLRYVLLTFVLVGVSLLAGCVLPYYGQAIGGQMKLLRARTPIDDVLGDPAVDSELKSKLEGIVGARRFAVERLGLPDNDSYTSYVDLGRPYVVWNVVSAEEFSIEPVTWCFPFAGCVAYRGYFDRENAERFQAKLAAKGYDTYSGGSSAYSTLGYFKDPILSTMLDGGEAYSAALLFHELAHQRVYFKGDSSLSEAFATAVEESGMELWLSERQGPEALGNYRARLRRRTEFGALVARQRERLSELYAADLSAVEMRTAKAEAFETMRAEYAELKQEWNGAGDYDGWFARDLNNASLAAVATYRRWVPALRWRLDQVGFEAFYEEMERFVDLERDERERRLASWDALRSGAAPSSES